MAGLPPAQVALTGSELPARRPRYSALGSRRGLLLPDLEDALARYLNEVGPNSSTGEERETLLMTYSGLDSTKKLQMSYAGLEPIE
jgi:hypothetical protein